MKCTGRKPPK